jgi:hypothetical protein
MRRSRIVIAYQQPENAEKDERKELLNPFQ